MDDKTLLRKALTAAFPSHSAEEFDLDAFAERFTILHLEEGDTLFELSEASLGLYMLVQGSVALDTPQGQRLRVVESPGRSLNFGSALGQFPHSNSAQAAAASKVALLKRDHLKSLLALRDVQARALVRLIAREIVEDIETLNIRLEREMRGIDRAS